MDKRIQKALISVRVTTRFKKDLEDIAEENKDVDCWPLARAIDTILI